MIKTNKIGSQKIKLELRIMEIKFLGMNQEEKMNLSLD
jgi:hypothetical protein